MGEERVDPLGCRRHDGQPVAPSLLEESLVDLLEGSDGHDLTGLWLLHRPGVDGGGREVVDDRGHRHRSHRSSELGPGLGVDVAGDHRHGKARPPEAAGGRRRLTEKALAGQ